MVAHMCRQCNEANGASLHRNWSQHRWAQICVCVCGCVCLFYYKKNFVPPPLFVTQLEEYYLTYISENFFCNSNYIFVWLHGPIIAPKHTNLERGVESKAIKSSTIPRYSFSKCKFTPSEFGSPKVVSLSNLFFYGDDNTIVRVQIVMISKGLRKT